MIEVYITDIRQWNEEAVYHEWLNRLPAERKERAESCRHAADQRRSLAGTLLVYKAFAAWQGSTQSASVQTAVSQNEASETPAPDMAFAYGSDGKPYLPAYPQFHFSISHSGDYAVCAVSEKEVGVDIQEIRPVKTDIAKRFFTEAERAQIERAHMQTGHTQNAKSKHMLPDENNYMLFRIWSAKESYVKLTGRGMAEGLTTFTADMEAGRIYHENAASADRADQCKKVTDVDDTISYEDTECRKTAYLKEYEAPEHYVLTVCGYEQEFGGLQTYEI